MNDVIDPTLLLITAVVFLVLGGAAGFCGGYWKRSHDELESLDHAERERIEHDLINDPLE